jgi:hypothetical protein
LPAITAAITAYKEENDVALHFCRFWLILGVFAGRIMKEADCFCDKEKGV